MQPIVSSDRSRKFRTGEQSWFRKTKGIVPITGDGSWVWEVERKVKHHRDHFYRGTWSETDVYVRFRLKPLFVQFVVCLVYLRFHRPFYRSPRFRVRYADSKHDVTVCNCFIGYQLDNLLQNQFTYGAVQEKFEYALLEYSDWKERKAYEFSCAKLQRKKEYSYKEMLGQVLVNYCVVYFLKMDA
ncbi:hypothetical protein M5689_015487 [Euphorbia peplus]|nr:hypothetical protein M5689_015487 [Euphorbia peplus]